MKRAIVDGWETDKALDYYQRALTIFAPEVLVNVGATLGNSPAAEPVFNAVIELGANVVGLNTPICFETDTELTLDEFGSIRAPMARAIALRYRIDTRGVGRRTGQLLSELSKAGDRLLGAPYAALRWPQQYRSALRRRMASVLIAIDVARAGSRSGEERRTSCATQSIAAARTHNMNAQAAKIRKLPADRFAISFGSIAVSPSSASA